LSLLSNSKAAALCEKLLDGMPDGWSIGCSRWRAQGMNHVHVYAPLFELVVDILVDEEGRISVRGLDVHIEEQIFDSPGEAAEHALRCR